VAFWDAGDNHNHDDLHRDGDGGGGSGSGSVQEATEATTAHLPPLAACTTPEARAFPLLRCAVSDDGTAVAAAGGTGGKSSFLGTPVWFHDL
jgi:hypothetical protein